MGTKCIVIGESSNKKPKPIEITKYLNTYLSIESNIDIVHSPRNFRYAELICKHYDGEVDLMFFYNDPYFRNEGILALGKWNDGVV